MGQSRANAYARRFERVFRYIDEHLDEPLSVAQLSDVAHFSRCHFHRQFSQYVGLTVGRYIQLVRLRRASYRLVFESGMPITTIAFDACFENAESFSRAFKQMTGQTPSQFRKAPAWLPWAEKFQLPTREGVIPMDVTMIDFPATDVAVLAHRGAPALLNNTVQQFIGWRKRTGLSPVNHSETFGICYDDPNTTPADQFRFDVCGSVMAPVPENPEGVITGQIPAGRCAVVRHHGSLDEVGQAAYYLYREWLPASGEELRDFPLFFHYRNLRQDTPENELVTDVCLPLV